MGESSKFWISREGQNYGPYSVEELKTYVEQGHFSEEDSACEAKEGANWKSVGDFTLEIKRTARLDESDFYKGSSSNKKSTGLDERDFYKGGSSGNDETADKVSHEYDGLMAKAPKPDKKISKRIEKELSGDELIIELMEACMEKAAGDEKKARSIYEKVRLKQLFEEKKEDEKKVGIGCFFLFLIWLLFAGLCSDDSKNGGSKGKNSYSYKQGYGDGYIVGKADKRDGNLKTLEMRERLASFHKNNYDEPFLYESGWNIGWIDGYQGNPKEH